MDVLRKTALVLYNWVATAYTCRIMISLVVLEYADRTYRMAPMIT